jgi:tetratricopeptide (TPR) repeat protein
MRETRPEDIERWPATALFWERAQAVRPSLILDAGAASLVGDICRKLDGLPLAIELAAARVRHLPLAGILEQIEHRLEFLVGGPVDLPLRQRTIRDTVGWSHDLLDVHEQTLFRRLSVFAGGWTLDAIPEVSGDYDRNPLHGISGLVDQNLVVLDSQGPDPRYTMLDIVHEYAAARLRDSGETDDVERRHAEYYLTLAETAEAHLVRTGHQDWFRRLDIDRGNLRSAMAWTIDRGDATLALRFIVALWRYWRQLGELEEGKRWSDEALAIAEPVAPALRAKALCAAAALSVPQADHQRMTKLSAEAIGLAYQSDDPMDLRNALTIQGFVAMCQSRYTDALGPYTECVRICEELGPSWQLATSHLNLATALLHSGHLEDSVVAFHNALHLYRQLGDDIFAARVQNHLAHAALARDDVSQADRLARDALTTVAEHSEPQGIAEALETLAAIAAVRSHGERSATLAGSATAIRESIASRAAPFDTAIMSQLISKTKAMMSEEQWHHSYERGLALGPAAAVQYALAGD